MKATRFYATGRRKTAIARVWLSHGSGQVDVNGRDLLGYFRRDVLRMLIEQPLKVTEHLGKLDIRATVVGGGLSGQAGAVRLGISRALVAMDESLRPVLRRNDLMTRDPRERERKKYGRPGARKRFQYSKR
ncbi:30S ribosomal protein S9 [candidate division KSB1 bacterium]|nr:MAG: 30S ribosomal protein S9 [candidate division KSB1 bacterium]